MEKKFVSTEIGNIQPSNMLLLVLVFMKILLVTIHNEIYIGIRYKGSVTVELFSVWDSSCQKFRSSSKKTLRFLDSKYLEFQCPNPGPTPSPIIL